MVQEFIGQNKAKLLISEWKSRDSFPHFMLIVGEEGSGRKTISRFISKELDCHLELRTDLSAGSVRQLIDIAYRTMSKILYVIPNADTMSIQAKNLFLKFTEEPPENAYIILTLNSLGTSCHMFWKQYVFKASDTICFISSSVYFGILINPPK